MARLSPDSTDFGYLRGEYYTFWYDKPTGNFDGPNNPNLIQGLDGDWYIGCPGDLAVKSLGFQPGENSPSLHGYMDMKPYLPNPKSGGTALIRDVIHGVVDFDDSMDVGDPVYPEPGTKTAAREAIQDRVSDPTWGDTDYTTVKYYNTAQVPNGPFPYDSALFTPDVDTMNNVHRIEPPLPNFTYHAPPGNNRRILGTPCCAEYIGPGLGSGGGGGAGGAGLFRIMLFR